MSIKEWIAYILKNIFKKTAAPTVPVDEPVPVVYEFTPGHYVERVIDITKGWCRFEVYVDEAGRIDDWSTAEIFCIYDAAYPYHTKKGNAFILLPYKVKACRDNKCAEPRFKNLPWSRWRKVELEWSTTSFNATIDGQRVSVQLLTPWGSETRAIYGCHPNGHCLKGGKIRGMEWG